MTTAKFEIRRGTYQQWFDANPKLSLGEIGYETNTKKFKVGDGNTFWNDLDYSTLNPDEIYSYVDTAVGNISIPPAYITSVGTNLAVDSQGNLTVDLTDYALTTDIPSLTGYATETYVGTQISNLVNGAPAALNTLKELADAINDDSSYAASVTTSLGLKAPIDSPTFTGTVTLPNSTVTNNMLAGSIANNKLSNSSITINGTAISLGGSVTINSFSAPTIGSTQITSGSTITTIQDLSLSDPLIKYHKNGIPSLVTLAVPTNSNVFQHAGNDERYSFINNEYVSYFNCYANVPTSWQTIKNNYQLPTVSSYTDPSTYAKVNVTISGLTNSSYTSYNGRSGYMYLRSNGNAGIDVCFPIGSSSWNGLFTTPPLYGNGAPLSSISYLNGLSLTFLNKPESIINSASISYLSNVTSDIQSQIDKKLTVDNPSAPILPGTTTFLSGHYVTDPEGPFTNYGGWDITFISADATTISLATNNGLAGGNIYIVGTDIDGTKEHLITGSSYMFGQVYISIADSPFDPNVYLPYNRFYDNWYAIVSKSEAFSISTSDMKNIIGTTSNIQSQLNAIVARLNAGNL